MNGNRPTTAHCPLCGAIAMNPSYGKTKVRLYCERCRRFFYIGPRKPYGYGMTVQEDLAQVMRYLWGSQPSYPKPEDMDTPTRDQDPDSDGG